MRIWLDDMRPAPEGWIRCYWPSEVIALLEAHNGTLGGVVLSLDHDLGDDARGTGYDVLAWLEEHVATHGLTEVPVIHIHTANPVAHARMEDAAQSIAHLARSGS